MTDTLWDFVDKEVRQQYQVNNRNGLIELELILNQHVFPFSAHGMTLAEVLTVEKNETVRDVGTGAGPLAIISAKMGGIVTASDISIPALDLAKKNAKLNSVTIETRCEPYFGPGKEVYDVIIMNLPQEIVPPNYRNQVNLHQWNSVYSGEMGNEHIIHGLQEAVEHMHKNSRLYTLVHSVTDYKETFRVIQQLYRAEHLGIATAPVKAFMQKNADYYLDLARNGTIIFYEKDETYYDTNFLLKLTKKT